MPLQVAAVVLEAERTPPLVSLSSIAGTQGPPEVSAAAQVAGNRSQDEGNSFDRWFVNLSCKLSFDL